MSEMKTYLEEHAHDSDNIVMVPNEQVETWEDVLESIKTAMTDYANAHADIARSNMFYVGIEVSADNIEHHFNTIVPWEYVVDAFGQRDAFDAEIVEPTANKLLFSLKKVVPEPKDITKVVVYATEIVDITKVDDEDKQ